MSLGFRDEGLGSPVMLRVIALCGPHNLHTHKYIYIEREKVRESEHERERERESARDR